MTSSTPQPPHHPGLRPRRLQRRRLRGPRQPRAAADHRPRTGRPADDHDRGGQLARRRRGPAGPGADGAHAPRTPSASPPRSSTTTSTRWTCGSGRFASIGDGGDLHLRCADHRDRRLGPISRACPPRRRFRGKGVSACATCDGFFFRGQRVAVIGGGNTAVEEALYLSNIAAHVTLVHRRDRLRAEKILQDRLFERVSARARSASSGTTRSSEVLGDDSGVNGLRLRPRGADGATRDLAVTGVFIAIGHTPNTGMFDGPAGDARAATSWSRAAARAMRRRPACPACSPPATSPITSTARRSPRPAPAAWRRWMRTDISSGSTRGGS